MSHRKTLVAAAVVAGTLLAGSTAFALSAGLVPGRARDGAGGLSPVASVVGTTGAASGTDSSATTASPAGPGDDQGGATATSGDDSTDRGEIEGRQHERPERAGEHHEGRDDDD